MYNTWLNCDGEKEGQKGTIGNMKELELCSNLGLVLDPEENRLEIGKELRQSIKHLSRVFSEMNNQKTIYGTLNKDLWLELIPWHSLN